MDQTSYAITISRQLGSGGAYVGRQLAERLGFFYMDREILCQAAKELKVLEETLEHYEERKTTLWESILQACTVGSTGGYIPPHLNMVNDSTLYMAESDIIQKMAKTKSAVIIGRAGSYVLKEHPRHVSAFLHAGTEFRIQRVRELYMVSEKQAEKMIIKSDLERKNYFQAIAGQNWMDLQQYHLAIKTDILGLEKTEQLIFDYVQAKFGKLPSAVQE
jgi:CMP/dCMP kinase